MNKYKAIADINGLMSLSVNWDGDGSPPITQDACERALNIVRIISRHGYTPDPFIYPTPGGGVQFEWTIGGKDLELFVNEYGSLSVFAGWGKDGEMNKSYLLNSNVRFFMYWLTSMDNKPPPDECFT